MEKYAIFVIQAANCYKEATLKFRLWVAQVTQAKNCTIKKKQIYLGDTIGRNVQLL